MKKCGELGPGGEPTAISPGPCGGPPGPPGLPLCMPSSEPIMGEGPG